MDPIEITVCQFRKLTQKYALFHAAFFLVFISEILSILIFLPFLAKSFLLATLVAATFLTAFSYFVLRFYFQTKKPEQLIQLKNDYLQNCGNSSISALIERLNFHEYRFYSFLEPIEPLLKKLSIWVHFQDVLMFKELLYEDCRKSLLEKVKSNPTSIEGHRDLANCYISHYKLYKDQNLYPFIAKKYASLDMVKKFERYAKCAAEELKIILHYIPHDRWALTQLGDVCRDLHQREEERKIYETLLELEPNEKDIQLRLGSLYFQLGFMAKGLKIYEDLLQTNDPKAEELIRHYDAFHTEPILQDS